jgi:hypothetical protein
MNGIINVEALGLSDIYLKMSDEHRYEACIKVLEQALKSIDMTNEIEVKKEYVNKLLEKSIQYYVKDEDYESAQLLSDLQEVLNQKY